MVSVQKFSVMYVWSDSTSTVANHQIRHEATSKKGCHSGDCMRKETLALKSLVVIPHLYSPGHIGAIKIYRLYITR